MAYQLLIFDLDGTLIDTTNSVVNAMLDTEEQLNINVTSFKKATSLLGPPTKLAVRDLHPELSPDEQLNLYYQFIKTYTEKHLFEVSVYPKIPETLDYLKQQGYKICLATLKEKEPSLRLLEKVGLKKYFEYFANVSETVLNKADLLQKMLDDFQCQSKDALMIGDSIFDAKAASDVRMDFFGCLYGFGFKTEEDALNHQAIGFSKTPEELLSNLKMIL